MARFRYPWPEVPLFLEMIWREVLTPQGESMGFEVLGREQDAEERGCSIAADEMLTSHSSSLESDTGAYPLGRSVKSWRGTP